jgi:hypothetical protein
MRRPAYIPDSKKVSREAADSLAFADAKQGARLAPVTVDQKIRAVELNAAVARSEKHANDDEFVKRIQLLGEAENLVPLPPAPRTVHEYETRLAAVAGAALEWGFQVFVLPDVNYPLTLGLGMTYERPGLRLARAGNSSDVRAQGRLMEIEQAVQRVIKETQQKEERQRLLDEYNAKIHGDRAEALRRKQVSAQAPELLAQLQAQIDALKASAS